MDTKAIDADWIAVDWGTTNLRAWAIQDGSVVATGGSDQGMGVLAPEGFEAALLDVIAPWLDRNRIPLVACGMVGAKTGWSEAPYRAVPCSPVAASAVRPKASDPRLDVAILPGLSQQDPPDVMRGEETQIAGFLAKDPQFNGVLCLPGTHTKWVQMSAGEVISFRTFMTGELFALLSEKSILRHSMRDDWSGSDFADGVGEAMSRPEALANRLFSLRAASLVVDEENISVSARLSGLLIGAELAAARPYWLGQRIALIGDPKLSGHYSNALALQGVNAETENADAVTLAGLTVAYQTLRDLG